MDTTRGIRQVFPVFGSYSATGLYYAGSVTRDCRDSGTTSGFANLSLQIASIARNGGVVTVTTGGKSGGGCEWFDDDGVGCGGRELQRELLR